MKTVGSLVRWAGSKRKLLPVLMPYWNSKKFKRYVEPFAGSACLFFELNPKAALLGDLNTELISTYKSVRRDPDLVLECFKRLPKGEKNYYRIREIDPASLSDFDRAARFLYLNRWCFNGLYRTNKAGKFNVPYGGRHKISQLDEETLFRSSKTLKGATLVNADFEKTIARAKKGDFYYMDPPYVVESRRVFAEYLPGTFISKDLERLGKMVEKLDKKGVHFLVSYADCALIRRLFKKWHIQRIWTRRNIAGFSGSRRGTYELLISNFLPSPGERK